jgi:ABC-2 type transport system ATP-binding protein
MNVIESSGLGKRYRRAWALRECTLAIPGGHVVALVGPNGAGKTTLLHMSVGLTVAGEVDDLLAGHRILTGPAAEAARYAGRLRVVHAWLVRRRGA